MAARKIARKMRLRRRKKIKAHYRKNRGEPHTNTAQRTKYDKRTLKVAGRRRRDQCHLTSCNKDKK
jgi:hypothetical protein